MKLLLCTAALVVTALARPELYKEKEDFQFSRSSTDEGSKSGYYGAQRGNMGGNYEKAHNMDNLAQHQMGSLVNQVDGELGDTSNTKAGSVYTSSNSRGVLGSGRYDLSNLQGRNFQEGATFGDSQSHSSLTSHNSGYSGHSLGYSGHNAGHSRHDAGYNGHLGASEYSQSQNARYQGVKNSDYGLQSGNLQTAENQGALYDQAHSSGYSSHSGYQSQTEYEQAYAGSGSHINTRLVGAGAVPVRVVVRPGTRVTIPVAAQTYEATHGASSVDQNSISSDAEILSHVNKPSIPTSKHYESEYSYRKQWEKHSAHPEVVPLAIPSVTDNPFPINSELYEDSLQKSQAAEAHQIDSHSSNYHNDVKSSQSSQTRYQSGQNSNAYTHGAYDAGTVDANNLLGEGESKPKSYQSSYSYHKSWERQGDPYVIVPAGGVQAGAAERLTDSSKSHAYSNQYRSGYKQGQTHSHGNLLNCDCDEYGNVRVGRSVDQQIYQEAQNFEGLQTEDLTQQQTADWQLENKEDYTQQSQQLTQQHKYGGSERLDYLDDINNQWTQQLTQQHKNGASERLEDLDDINNQWTQQTEDLTQQAQHKW